MKAIYLAATFSLLFGAFAANAQEDDKVSNYIKEANKKIDYDDNKDDIYLPTVSRYVRKILEACGNTSYWELRANDNISNAAAKVHQNKRYIFYNPDFIRKAEAGSTDKWTVYGVFAHEVGHHVNFHLTSEGDRHDEELQADRFSGFVLARLGASLEDAKKAIKELTNERGSLTHPPKNERLVAVERGWKDGSKGTDDSNFKLVQRLIDEAETAIDDGDRAKAMRKFERVLSIDPENSFAKNQLKQLKKLSDNSLHCGPHKHEYRIVCDFMSLKK